MLRLGTLLQPLASTTDEQLLRDSAVTLPILDVQLPIRGFYTFVPWLFLLAHFNVLFQLTQLARKLRVFDRYVGDVREPERTALRERLPNILRPPAGRPPAPPRHAGRGERRSTTW